MWTLWFKVKTNKRRGTGNVNKDMQEWLPAKFNPSHTVHPQADVVSDCAVWTMSGSFLRFDEQLFSQSLTLSLLSKLMRTPAERDRSNERHEFCVLS